MKTGGFGQTCAYLFFVFTILQAAFAEKLLTTSSQAGGGSGELEIWLAPRLLSQPHRLFTSIHLQVNLSSGFDLYQSSKQSALFEEYAANNRLLSGWFRGVALWKTQQISPFTKTYIGIASEEPYLISVKITNVDFTRLAAVLLGLGLFLWGRQLARNVIFFYSGGTAIGLLASILVVVFILARLLPRRSATLSFLIGGWSFSLYLLYSLWQNLYQVLVDYQKWVAVYLVTISMLSFGVCYRLGPPSHPRSLNLCQWLLQGVGLCMIYGGCQIPELSLAFCCSLILVQIIPKSFFESLQRIWQRLFPPTPKFLTEEEYHQQGVEETRKALAQLRTFCKSPECNSWRLVNTLTSPSRLAEFVEGSSHLSDREVLQYDTEVYPSKDEDDDESDDSSDWPPVPARHSERPLEQFPKPRRLFR